MFIAMALKELREVRGIALAALAAYLYLVAVAINQHLPLSWSSREQMGMPPFVNDGGFYSWYVIICGATTIALGLRQTLGESIHGTYPFLFHRPTTRRWLIAVKLLVGLGVYLVCGLVPILAYGVWAATPGTHASPFEWSMSEQAWILWIGMPILYFGAFLSGIRPGRWLGTRLLPGVAAGFAVIGAMGFALAGQQELLGLSLAFVVDIWMVVVIFFVTRTRDYA